MSRLERVREEEGEGEEVVLSYLLEGWTRMEEMQLTSLSVLKVLPRLWRRIEEIRVRGRRERREITLTRSDLEAKKTVKSNVNLGISFASKLALLRLNAG